MPTKSPRQYKSSLSFNMFSESDMKSLQETADAHGLSVNEVMRRIVSEAVSNGRLGSVQDADTDDVALLYADAVRQDGYKSGTVNNLDGVKVYVSEDLTLKIDAKAQTVCLLTNVQSTSKTRPSKSGRVRPPQLTPRQRKFMMKFDKEGTIQVWTGKDRRTLLSLMDKGIVDIIEGSRDHLYPVFEITQKGMDIRRNFRKGKS